MPATLKRLVWTKDRPKKPGWYWFRTSEDSPKLMTRLEESIVQVGQDPDSNRCGVKFPSGAIAVFEMGGYFAGPIPAPSDD